jgi:hypothetical protein
VPNRADVHVRFASIEFFFGHVVYVPLNRRRCGPPAVGWRASGRLACQPKRARV